MSIPMFPLVIGLAFLAGVVAMPALLYLFGKELGYGTRAVVSRILWTIGALIHDDPYVLYKRDSGRYQIVRADAEENVMYVDGETVPFDPDGNWSYLGKTRFGISWEKSERAFDGTLFDTEQELQTDGGIADLRFERGGNRAVSTVATAAEGLIVEVHKVVGRLRGAAGSSVADQGKREALIDHGGGGSFSTKWLVIGVISSMVLGAIFGYLAFFL